MKSKHQQMDNKMKQSFMPVRRKNMLEIYLFRFFFSLGVVYGSVFGSAFTAVRSILFNVQVLCERTSLSVPISWNDRYRLRIRARRRNNMHNTLQQNVAKEFEQPNEWQHISHQASANFRPTNKYGTGQMWQMPSQRKHRQMRCKHIRTQPRLSFK